MEADGIPDATPDMGGDVGRGPVLLFGASGRFGVDWVCAAAEDGPPALDVARVVAPMDVDDAEARNGMEPGLDEVEAMRRLTDGVAELCVCSGDLQPGQGGFDGVCARRGMDDF